MQQQFPVVVFGDQKGYYFLAFMSYSNLGAATEEDPFDTLVFFSTHSVPWQGTVYSIYVQI